MLCLFRRLRTNTCFSYRSLMRRGKKSSRSLTVSCGGITMMLRFVLSTLEMAATSTRADSAEQFLIVIVVDLEAPTVTSPKSMR